MGFKREDGTLDDPCGCVEKLKPGEPFFLLRGQDKFAPALVRLWANLLEEFGGADNPKVEEAYDLAEAMEKWPHRKLPD